MKISIITVCFNAEKTIHRALESIKNQTYPDIEHIVVDGQSKDATVNIIKSFPHVAKCISEPDEGMWDAMNKGIQNSSGDYVGILNADDVMTDPTVIERLVKEIEQDQKDVYFGDIRFVKAGSDKTQRYYSSKGFRPSKFSWGYMPAHPSTYIKRSLFKQYGYYKIDYYIAADYELLTRYLYTKKASFRYLPLLMVDMEPGGRSNQNLRSRYILNKEIVRACRENGISTNLLKVSLKYLKKWREYVSL